MKKNKLKKLSIFALTTALTVSCLAGCGKKKEEDTEQATITTEGWTQSKESICNKRYRKGRLCDQ